MCMELGDECLCVGLGRMGVRDVYYGMWTFEDEQLSVGGMGMVEERDWSVYGMGKVGG